MKCEHLYEEFRRYEGQPVKIFTDDERTHCGIVITPYDDAVRILDKCSRTILVEYAHIDAVAEPKMELRRCCRDHCECEREHEEEREEERDCDHEHREYR